MANLGGVQAASPSPTERWDQAGIGEAEFFPRCIAAGCSPTNEQQMGNVMTDDRFLLTI